ncbi:NAD(P)-dependent oxidoreductase [Mucilaginibacter angelicae]|uniref:NAD(P)-dependent oxidoreductase n=1 Tax=Mucilaginibacter angelicae TaxID=869718 RepID=A0ABV6L947_9SPHI
MKILLIGASGNIGQRILKEALGKGYDVTAAQRTPNAITLQHPNLSVIKADLLDSAGLPALLKGFDVVISSISPVTPEQFKKANENLITALEQQAGTRVIIVGGAGSTEISPGLRLMDSPVMDQLPKEWAPVIFIHAEVLDLYKNSSLDWSYFSPPKFIEPGERTGKYRLGSTNMIFDANGESKISNEDYALALIDELEKKQQIRKQFSIGY